MKTMRLSVSAILLLSSVAVATSLIGCGSGNRTIADAHPVYVMTRSVTTPTGILLTLAEDKSSISAGQDVTYTVTLTNTTSAPINYLSVDNCTNTVIPGLDSAILIVNTATKTTQSLGLDGGCNNLPLSAQKQLAPGASLTNSIRSGTVLTSPGAYKATLNIYDPVPLLNNATSSSQPPQSVTLGPLDVVVTE